MLFDAINYVTYAAAVAGGIALAAAPLTASGRAAPQWTRIALWISGPASLSWGVLGYALICGSCWASSTETFNLLRHFKTLLGGVVIGVLLLLLVSAYANRPR